MHACPSYHVLYGAFWYLDTDCCCCCCWSWSYSSHLNFFASVTITKILSICLVVFASLISISLDCSYSIRIISCGMVQLSYIHTHIYRYICIHETSILSHELNKGQGPKEAMYLSLSLPAQSIPLPVPGLRLALAPHSKQKFAPFISMKKDGNRFVIVGRRRLP
jgi:hypothetical protein